VADKKSALRILAALQRSPVGTSAVLVGSSGLFGFETDVPALTEDIDIAVPESMVDRRGPEIVEALREQGFDNQPGTASFSDFEGVVFDLLGHGNPEQGDHIGGSDRLRVMVFEDLSRLLPLPQVTAELPAGGRALTPVGFVATKLLTERAHKGAKDKLQALLVIAERLDDEVFQTELCSLLATVDPVRLHDVRAGAQHALFALQKDPTFSDAGAEGYAPRKDQVEVGFDWLVPLLEKLRG